MELSKLFSCVLFAAVLLSGCGQESENTGSKNTDDAGGVTVEE